MFEITIKGTTADEIRLGINDLAKLLTKINPDGVSDTAIAAMMAPPVQSAQPQIQTPAPNAAAAYQVQQQIPAVPVTPPAAPIAQPQQAPVMVPTANAPTYTLEQLAVAATPLTDAGRQQELIGLLAQFGVQALTHLPKEQYGAFATALRGMGAKI